MHAFLTNQASRRGYFFRPRVKGPAVGVCLAGWLLVSGVAAADEHYIIGDDCHFAYGDLGTCTANEIRIASASEAVTNAKFCIEGDPVEIEQIIVVYGLNTGVRYDPLLWIGQAGNDPRIADPGPVCYVSSVPPPVEPPPDPPDADYSLFDNWEGDDGDSCLDVAKPGEAGTTNVRYRVPVTVTCRDSGADADSNADFEAVVTWHQNTQFNCGTNTADGEDFGPGAPPKCDWSLLSLNIPVFQHGAVLTLLKEVDNEGGGVAVDTDWTLSASGPVSVSGVEGDPEITAMKVPVGVYTLGESGPGGYAASDWSCTGGTLNGNELTLAADEAAACTVTNTFITEQSLRVTKIIISDDGGSATLDDFDVSVDAVEVAWSNPASTTGGSELVASEPGIYTLSEADVGGYTEGTWSCIDGEGHDVPVTNGGHFSGADVTVAPGQDVTCSITNDDLPPPDTRLTLLKSVINDNGGDAEPGDFTLRLDGGGYANSPFSSGDSPPVVAAVEYTLSEDELIGYENLGVTCYDVIAEEVVPHPVTLAEDQEVACTITNDDIRPPLWVIKHVINDDGGDAVASDWTMVVTATDPSDNFFPGAEAPGTQITIDAGSYSVDETGGPEGYQETLSDGCEGSLGVGESAVCIITNDDIQPSLTITKTILFNDEGPATLGDFDVRVDGDPVAWANPASTTGGSETVATYAKTYTLSEADLEGYDEGAWSCSDADGDVPVSNDGLFSGADVTVSPGQDVTCGISNVYGPVEQSLKVEKIIVSNDGGTATLGDFNVSVDGEEVAWPNPGSTTGGIQLVGIEAKTYTLSEADLEGYDEGAWSCSDADGDVPVSNDGLFSGADVTVSPGQDVTCGISNVYGPVEQSLTVEKIIVSDNGGKATVKDFDVSVNEVEVDWLNPDSTTGDTRRVADLPGTYRLSEADLEDYVEGTWSCSDDDGPVSVSNDGHFSGADVTVEHWQDVRCSITNEDKFVPVPGLVVVKVIRSDNGGTATLDDFDVSVNGVEVAWDDPASLVGGSRFVSGKPGTYTLSEAEVDGYVEGRWTCRDASYNNVAVSNDGHFSGTDVTVAPEEQVTCTIANDDEKPKADLVVRKSIDPEIGECAVLVGQQLDFSIEVANAGPGLAEGVILEDHWSWQLKPTGNPDMYECDSPKERWIRCKLGNIEAGAARDVPFGFMVGGNPGEEACNLARASAYPDDNGNPEDNESEVCFDLVGELSPSCDNLPPADVCTWYAEAIEISGGVPPYLAEIEGLPEGFTGGAVESQVRIEGCSVSPSESEFTVMLSDRMACQETSANCRLVILPDSDSNCPIGNLQPSTIPTSGVRTPDPDVLPDESVQKIVVDEDRNRYLVGFTYRDHSYAADPNGPYVHHARNYDIRVVKYDDAGELLWDKTYDTGNDDYGYAVALNPMEDQPGLYVGGGVEVESGPHAWHDAVLLEIDPATGCPAGQHYQSAGMGTTSAYYDIATDGIELYAVGERQRNEKLAGEFGALISIYSHAELLGSAAACEGDQHILAYPNPPPAGDDPAEISTIVREGGLNPTVAYSVKVPEPDCENCPVLVAGRSELGGWVDQIVVDGSSLAPFLDPREIGDISVQDLAVPGNHVIVVGSSSANDMRILGYDRAGSTLWEQKNLGKGRLRGVATDEYGAFYVVGRSDDDASAGLIFKFTAAGVELDRGEFNPGVSLSFTDVAIFGPGTGVVAALSEEPEFDFGWLRVDFECAACTCPMTGR